MIAVLKNVEIAYLPNPRAEPEENDLDVRNDQFLALGLRPTKLWDDLLSEIAKIAEKYRDRADITRSSPKRCGGHASKKPRT
jgi:UDP-sulfoquinovose synthase